MYPGTMQGKLQMVYVKQASRIPLNNAGKIADGLREAGFSHTLEQ